MTSVTKSIDVHVPIRAAYNQWTRFEEFPRFMEGVRKVKQLDNRRLRWLAEVAGNNQEWYGVITTQILDQRLAWASTTGAKNDGTVTFQPLGPDTTRVILQLDYEPEGVSEATGDKLGFVSQRVAGDLARFKAFIEARGRYAMWFRL